MHEEAAHAVVQDFVAGGFASPECAWVTTIFQHLYEATSARDYDELALYAGRDNVTLYFTPRATARFGAAVSRYRLSGCDRPAGVDVVLLLGDGRAADPEWCELSYTERRAGGEGDRLDQWAA